MQAPDTWGQCYKTVFVCDLRISIIILNVCQTRLEKHCQGQKTQAYYKNLKITNVKSFLTLGPLVKVIKLIFSSFMDERAGNKIECLSLVYLFSNFWVYLSRIPSGCFPQGRLRALPANIRSGQKGLPETNTRSLYQPCQGQRKKSFMTLTPVPNVIKIFMSVMYEYQL